jgi:outer membrane lipopolysaccharide assembly protein LptE/RlpB
LGKDEEAEAIVTEAEEMRERAEEEFVRQQR